MTKVFFHSDNVFFLRDLNLVVLKPSAAPFALKIDLSFFLVLS